MDRTSVAIQRAVQLAELNSGKRGVSLKVLEASFGESFDEKYNTGHGTLREFLDAGGDTFSIIEGRVCVHEASLGRRKPPQNDELEEIIGRLYKKATAPRVARALGELTFHDAVVKSSKAVALVLERDFCCINDKDTAGRTPLALACKEGAALDIIELLTSHNARVNIPDCEEWAPLCYAARRGSLQVLRHLLAIGANVQHRTQTGDTALHLACIGEHGECIAHLLEAGSVPLPNNDGATPLHAAAASGSLPLVESIVEAMKSNATGAVCSRTSAGRTAAHAAAHNGHLECLTLLLDADASLLEAADCDGHGVLHEAAENGHSEMVRELLKKGAVTTVGDTWGRVPLHLASVAGNEAVIDLLGHEANHCDARGMTALHCACESGRAGCAGVLLEHGADMSVAINTNNYLAVHVAAAHNQRRVLEVLLAKCPELTESRALQSELTPLHVACINGSLEAIVCLLAGGSDVNAADSEGYSPLHLAAANPRVAVFEVLLAAKDLKSDTLKRAVLSGETVHDLLVEAKEGGDIEKLVTMVQEKANEVLQEEEVTERADKEQECAAETSVISESLQAEFTLRAYADEMKGVSFLRRFPYEELTLPSELEADRINVAMREMYIPDEEFKELFGVEKDRYKLWPAHRKETRKKELNLLEPQ